MAEIPVLYSDSFDVTLTPYGALFRFGARLPLPQQGAPTPQAAFVEQVRLGMSLGHLKVMAAILVRELMKHEGVMKQQIIIPDEALQSVGLNPADWRRFWGLPEESPAPAAVAGPVAGALIGR